MGKKQINSILHFHAASVGEVTCAFRVIKCLSLKGYGSLDDKFVLLTYTSNSVKSLIKEEELKELGKAFIDIKIKKYKKKKIISLLNKKRSENNILKMLLIIMEKDRKLGLLKYYKQHDGRIFNIEAKPPQSQKNKFYEKYISKSLEKIDFFLCESKNYKKDILEYSSKANIAVTGTIKGSIDKIDEISNIDGVVNIAYISVRLHEVTALAKIINNLKEVKSTIRHIIIPRYVEPSIYWPPKDIIRFVAKARKSVGEIIVIKKYDDLSKTLDDIKSGIIIYQKMGDVLGVLNNIHVAVVCGSLCHGIITKSKGHNVFEPLSRNIPTIIGKKHVNWDYTMKEMLEEEILISEDPNKMHAVIKRLLSDSAYYEEISRCINGSSYLEYHRQSTKKASDHIKAFFLNNLGRERGHIFDL